MRFTAAVLALLTIIGRYGCRAEGVGEGEYYEGGGGEILEGEVGEGEYSEGGGEEEPEAPPTTGEPIVSPSVSPSVLPSFNPSDEPSSEPSSQPSDTPSCAPSVSPTESPSFRYYYPDWSANGCLNDGNEPAYMSVNPSAHMHTTLAACCDAYFAMDDQCKLNSSTDCEEDSFPYYPDWLGENEGCINDGKEPAYMRHNPTYVFSSLEDCCKAHYAWKLEDCDPKESPGHGLWYPDWESVEGYCKQSGVEGKRAPKYMDYNPSMWMHTTRKACCDRFYSWAKQECNGNTDESEEKYYPDWDNSVCANDGKQPSYMTATANPDEWLYDTLEQCCEARFIWKKEACIGSSSGGNAAKFYMDYVKGFCVQNCDGALPCGGVADTWDELYDTIEACCAGKDWWNPNCETQAGP